MKLAIIGYGKMGKEIESIAKERGHLIYITIDQDNLEDFDSDEFELCDAAIEFSKPEVAVSNFQKCFDKKIPVISGTTGWLEKWDEVIDGCTKKEGTFFYASNFSLGVNILFRLNQQLAKIMNEFNSYDVEIEETHHTQKLDAPSGTAISLAKDIIDNIERKEEWKLTNVNNSEEIKITANRLQNVPGEHVIKYDSIVDTLELKHSAKNRKGFALGAVLAAEFVVDKKGVFSMNDLLNF